MYFHFIHIYELRNMYIKLNKIYNEPRDVVEDVD